MTNKPMLSVERELLERFVSDVEVHNYGFDGLDEMRALLDKKSCGACGGCANGCKLDRESPQIEPAAKHHGDPVEEKSAALQDMTDLFVEAHDESVAVGKANFVLAALEKIYDSGYRKQPMPVAAPITDEQILEAMRPAMMSADGGYVFDTAKDDVIEAGRALLAEVARLNGVKP